MIDMLPAGEEKTSGSVPLLLLTRRMSGKIDDLVGFWEQNQEVLEQVFGTFESFEGFFHKTSAQEKNTTVVGKKIFIHDLHGMPEGSHIAMEGWVKSIRNHSTQIFLDLVDSSGLIQCVIPGKNGYSIREEDGVKVIGTIHYHKGTAEIHVQDIQSISSQNGGDITARSERDPFNGRTIDHLLRYRHLYLRNPKLIAMMQLRDLLQSEMRGWFEQNRFVSFDAPILTPVPLYENDSAIRTALKKQNVYLTQCVGYYLEAAAHGLEKVYNMGPSFRGEEGRSKRHLMEYWHIKAEWCWDNLDGVMGAIENIIPFLIQQLRSRGADFLKNLGGTTFCEDGLKTPYPRITYRECVKILAEVGFDIEFGKSLGSAEEEYLSHHLFPHQPFWIVGIPRAIEPFPYSIDPKDREVCMVADLITSNGCGELLGVAEKIHDPNMLLERMREKGRDTDPRYEFVREVHASGCVPHVAFGMGLERLMRWLIGNDHVRDCHGFPRIFGRIMNP